jgi:PqqD family protein of HPr-rel-A system
LPATRPKARPDLTWVEIDGEAVIYDEGTGRLHHLNPTATIVFSHCSGDATIKEFTAAIADAFGVGPDDVEGEIRSLIRAFRRAGLLEPSGSRG